MDNKKSLYETIFIVNNTIGEEAVKEVVEKFTTLITNNGTIESINEWGNRRLAYPIQDLTDGYYVLVNFNSDHNFPAELDRLYNINDAILRSLIIKCD
ncbi:30S ribosomal protein S6 [Eubacteriales bacterium OttesenSCG-928-G02]|nr:30S ribosomal protein S6 [Eubacteriales bacterium OttesenSCG-928-G02]